MPAADSSVIVIVGQVPKELNIVHRLRPLRRHIQNNNFKLTEVHFESHLIRVAGNLGMFSRLVNILDMPCRIRRTAASHPKSSLSPFV